VWKSQQTRKEEKQLPGKKHFYIVVPVIMFVSFLGYKQSTSQNTIVFVGKKWTEQYILPYIIAKYV
jgi:osmoprotectant transport system permease protein